MSKENFKVLLSNQGKIINFLFDIGSHYLSRSWQDWTFPLRLPKNVAKLPVLHNQFPVTCVFSRFLKVKLDNFPTLGHESSKSFLCITGIMATREVVGGIFFAADELLGME